MTLQEALKVLEYHQKWRVGQTDPELTEAINVAINILKGLNKESKK